ncbi:hypothetical protein HMPREF9348_04051 [Escherichia coli MS 145-7]|nr:hypothetical protein HMPREF9348_04051 [Escherichia coli MS 145-7]
MFIEPRAPNNFMTTTCRIVVIKIVGWRELNPLPQYTACQH